jgi:Ni2+-binding GTPase involved in maturation of urease and hydrogenase
VKTENSSSRITVFFFKESTGNSALNETFYEALSEDRIKAVETGGCPHAAIREDITPNLIACEELTQKHKCDIILIESGITCFITLNPLNRSEAHVSFPMN